MDFTPAPASLRISLYPNYALGAYRPDFGTLSGLSYAVERHGKERVRQARPPWGGHPLRPMLAGAIAFNLVRRARRSGRFVKRMRTGCLTLLFGPPTLFLIVTVDPRSLGPTFAPITSALGCKADRTKQSAPVSLVPGAAPGEATLVLPHRRLRVRTANDVVRVLAFGGSTTEGSPYDDPEDHFDYPTQLEAQLNQSPALGGRAFQVLNLGKVAVPLGAIAAYLGPSIDATHPRVVMLSSVYNNYFEFDPWRLAGQVMGYPGARSPRTKFALDRYEDGLRCVARTCYAKGAMPLWIEEFIDRNYFGGDDILDPLHEVLGRVAAEEGVPVVKMQADIDREQNRLDFYEFIHPSSIGYRWMAERLAAWFVENQDRVLSEGPPPGSEGDHDLSICDPIIHWQDQQGLPSRPSGEPAALPDTPKAQ